VGLVSGEQLELSLAKRGVRLSNGFWVREKLVRTEDDRALVRQVFTSAVDLDPNPAQKTLTVRMH
jgi:hypothetical protein